MPGKNKIIAIVQARENSSRFPNKVLKYINEKTILEFINSKLKKSKNLSKIVFAIPKMIKNSIIIDKKKLTIFKDLRKMFWKDFINVQKYKAIL